MIKDAIGMEYVKMDNLKDKEGLFVMIVMDFLAVILLQTRIELTKLKKEQSQDFGYSFATLRSLACLAIAGCTFTVLYIIPTNGDKSIVRLKLHASVTVVLQNLVPMIMIRRNANICAYIKRKVSPLPV